jgi:antitoxin (DNA-binding transcriptional repressor) of toxin-antitoxin stability system
MTKVNVHDVKVHLSRYLDLVEKGEVVIVCRYNQPVAELRSIGDNAVRASRVPGLLKGRVSWEAGAFAPLNDEELAEFDAAPQFPPELPR